MSKDHELFQQSNTQQTHNIQSTYQISQSAVSGGHGGRDEQAPSMSLTTFPKFFMKAFEYFNHMAYRQSMQN